jgi:two-component system, NarL family, sensor histidine kinase UhpB
MSHSDPDLRRSVRDVVTQLNSAISGIRGYINALHTSASTPQGVVDSLEMLARGFSAEEGFAVRFTAAGVDEAGLLPDELGHHTEQILREALSNAARHSRADSADVRLTFGPDEFYLLVEDRGIGACIGDERDDGRGLRNMRERARRLGGRLTIQPRPRRRRARASWSL